MKNTAQNLAALFLGTCLVFMLLACQKRQVASPPNTVEQTKQKPPLELQSYSVHHVKLSWKNTVRDANDMQESFETAYLVKFALNNMPTDYGPPLIFYIGDYAVPEYGPWDGGIYFKIYQEEDLKALLGKEIFYQTGHETEGKKPISLQKKFEISDVSEFTMESEADVLKRK